MANTQSLCSSFLSQLMSAGHNFSATNSARSANTVDTFYGALYYATTGATTSTCLCASVTAYSPTVNGVSEVSGTNYTAGGVAITNTVSPAYVNTTLTAGAGYWTPSASIVFTNITITTAFDTLLMYNTSQSNTAVAVFTFGSQTISAGNFTLTMPANTSTTALVRLATS